MRSSAFRRAHVARRKKWAREIVARYLDLDSPKGRREVGRVAVHHTYCGCLHCRAPKLLDIPHPADRRSDDADRDALK
ncbi:MAG: hypothetical protein ABL949_14340 [Fimbriimonadaceae bacterium]